jgi:hypothetical protein
MLIIVIMTTLQILFFFTLLYNLTDYGNPALAQNLYSVLFTIALFCFPLNYGIRLWKAGKSETFQQLILPYNEKNISLHFQINQKEYRSLMLKLTYRNPIVLYVNIICLNILMASVINSNYNVISVTALIFLIIIPVTTIFQSTKTFSDNKMIKEPLTYDFTSNQILITGETFTSSIRWNSLYKIKELNNWFLLYNDKTSMIVVPKKSFNNLEEVQTIRNFALHTNSDVMKELKSYTRS